MDVAKSASSEWLNHSNLRGGRELLRLMFGYVAGVTVVLLIIASVQATYMASLQIEDIAKSVALVSRDLVWPLAGLWAMAMAFSSAVAAVVIHLKLHRSRPRLAQRAIKYAALTVFASFLILSSPPLGGLSLFSGAMVLQITVNVYLAGRVVYWAVLSRHDSARLVVA